MMNEIVRLDQKLIAPNGCLNPGCFHYPASEKPGNENTHTYRLHIINSYIRVLTFCL